MSPTRLFGRAMLAGVLLGALLAASAPPKAAIAREDGGCKCDDGGTGSYKCNAAQTACLAGGEVCALFCGAT